MNNQPLSLAEAFQQFFEIVPADTNELRDIVYRIRYQVYCKEMHFENEEDYPNGREMDEFDAHSVHMLLRHRPSGEYAGCVRLVLNRSNSSEPQLPLEHHCSRSLDNTILDIGQLDRSTFGEISRLAIVSRFRRRPGEVDTPHGVGEEAASMTPTERRVFPHIALGLYLAAAAMMIQSGIKVILVMMEPRLARHLRFFGIRFTQAGDVVDFHGMRGPFYINQQILFEHIKPEIRELLSIVDVQIKRARGSLAIGGQLH